jgi:hypothetical protein
MDFVTWIENKNVAILVSCVLGFGLAAIFRPVCKGPDCVILRGPPVSNIRGAVYQFGAKCHEFKPKPVECPADKSQVVDTLSFAAT